MLEPDFFCFTVEKNKLEKAFLRECFYRHSGPQMNSSWSSSLQSQWLFYSTVMESILSSSITIWHVLPRLQTRADVSPAEKVIGCNLPSHQDLYTSRAQRPAGKIIGWTLPNPYGNLFHVCHVKFTHSPYYAHIWSRHSSHHCSSVRLNYRSLSVYMYIADLLGLTTALIFKINGISLLTFSVLLYGSSTHDMRGFFFAWDMQLYPHLFPSVSCHECSHELLQQSLHTNSPGNIKKSAGDSH